MITGLTPKSLTDNLQLNAGAFFVGLEYNTATNAASLKELLKTNAAKCIGATVGGGSFVATPEVRQIEADGMRYPVKGSTMIDSWEVKLTGTMKEVTAKNVKLALATSSEETEDKVTTITLRTDLKDTNYLPSLVWVGDTSKGVVLIDLKNVLNIAGMTLTFGDKTEGTIPFEFKAHCGTLEEMENAPFVVKFYAD